MEGINYWAEIHREYSCRETLVEVRGGSFIKSVRYKTREEFHTKYAIKNEGGSLDGIQLLGGFIQNIPARGINNRGEFHTKFAKKNEGGVWKIFVPPLELVKFNIR